MKVERRDGELYLVAKPVKVFFADDVITEEDENNYTIVRLYIKREVLKCK